MCIWNLSPSSQKIWAKQTSSMDRVYFSPYFFFHFLSIFCYMYSYCLHSTKFRQIPISWKQKQQPRLKKHKRQSRFLEIQVISLFYFPFFSVKYRVDLHDLDKKWCLLVKKSDKNWSFMECSVWVYRFKLGLWIWEYDLRLLHHDFQFDL